MQVQRSRLSHARTGIYVGNIQSLILPGWPIPRDEMSSSKRERGRESLPKKCGPRTTHEGTRTYDCLVLIGWADSQLLSWHMWPRVWPLFVSVHKLTREHTKTAFVPHNKRERFAKLALRPSPDSRLSIKTQTKSKIIQAHWKNGVRGYFGAKIFNLVSKQDSVFWVNFVYWNDNQYIFSVAHFGLNLGKK